MKVYMTNQLSQGHNAMDLKTSRMLTYQIHPRRPGVAGCILG